MTPNDAREAHEQEQRKGFLGHDSLPVACVAGRLRIGRRNVAARGVGVDVDREQVALVARRQQKLAALTEYDARAMSARCGLHYRGT